MVREKTDKTVPSSSSSAAATTSPELHVSKHQASEARRSSTVEKKGGNDNGYGDDDNNDDDNSNDDADDAAHTVSVVNCPHPNPTSSSCFTWRDITFATVPNIAVVGLTLRTALGITIGLYVLNQAHLLPQPLASVVSKALFWPTLPITASKRIGKWVTRIDDTVVMGGAPFAFLGYPKRLQEDYHVQGVINMCEEYRGPIRQYKDLGIEELCLPTTDHFEPSQEDLLSALSFIQRYQAQGKSVYVHCRAGHGRSGAVVFAWLLLKDPKVDPQQLNADLCKIRNVRSSLWKQPNIKDLHTRLLRQGTFIDVHDRFFDNQK
jgi:atypical dual specificity phosphatase